MNPEQVQGTNDSSIVSKLSMVKMGYFEDPFIKHFVAKPSRRSPLINRCYYARAAAISYSVKKFLEASPSPRQIVSLGAGFDTTYFRLQEMGLTDNLYFLEVDFPDVVRRKIALAKRGSLFPNEQKDIDLSAEKSCSLLYRSDGYAAVGYDLQTVGVEFRDLLMAIGVDFNKPTLFLSEVVLTYLPSKKSSRVLQWIAKDFSNAVVTVFEQTSPNDSFGKIMCKHFKQIGSPLMAINDYPTIASHVERHRSFSFDYSSAISLDRLYNQYLEKEKRTYIQRLEVFDEFEAWNRACQHYFVLCSTNSKDKKLQAFASSLFQENSHCLKNCSIKEMNCMNLRNEHFLQRYGHCSSQVSLYGKEYIAIFGGFGPSEGSSAHQRLTDEVCLIDTDTGVMIQCKPDQNSRNILRFPMFGTALESQRQTVLLFGGRGSPMKSTNSVTTVTFTKTDSDDASWTYSAQVHQDFTQGSCPCQRWRHSAVVMKTYAGEEYMVTFGGRNAAQVFGDMWCYNVASRTWNLVMLSGVKVSPRHSHAMCTRVTDSNVVILSGGLDEHEEPCYELFELLFLQPEFTKAEVIRIVLNDLLPPIYSHTSHIVDSKLYLVGGVTSNINSKHGDEGPVDAIRVVCLSTRTWICYSIEPGIGHPLMLHNHSSMLSRTRNELIILGGGDNCFSFGTWFNRSPHVISLERMQYCSE